VFFVVVLHEQTDHLPGPSGSSKNISLLMQTMLFHAKKQTPGEGYHVTLF
jgi:hypothetical protein